jgi:hypothetical protein
MNALIYAAMRGHTKIIEILLENGANVNDADEVIEADEMIRIDCTRVLVIEIHDIIILSMAGLL